MARFVFPNLGGLCGKDHQLIVVPKEPSTRQKLGYISVAMPHTASSDFPAQPLGTI